MKKEYIETGKIVGTHGVRGGLRVQPWCDTPEFLCQFKTLFLKEQSAYNSVKVKSSKAHGNVVIMELDGVNSMDDAENLRGKVLFIKRKDLKLEEDQYLISDLIDSNVYDADSDELIGKISDVSKTGANDVWHINKDGKEYLIPVIDDVVINVNIDENKVVIRPLKGIFED
jgi:16S rRNA processing protein RimM